MKCPYKTIKVIKRVTKETTYIQENFEECDEGKCPFYRTLTTKSGDFSATKEICGRAEVEMGHTR